MFRCSSWTGQACSHVTHRTRSISLRRLRPGPAERRAILPLPDICVAALQLRADCQAAEHDKAADIWTDTGLVFTTTPRHAYEPRNFARHSHYAAPKPLSATSASTTPGAPARLSWWR